MLLIVDDLPESIEGALSILSDHLEAKGFSLKSKIAPDLSERGLRDLARNSGKEYDLVMVDYNLGRDDTNGAVAARRMRHELRYTDMVFYSSDLSLNLFAELAKEQVAGVFVADRRELSDALKGLADTVIGKAVDLNHMRGIAMAEVAEMDVLMEETLERVFESTDRQMIAKAGETLQKLQRSAEEGLAQLAPLVAEGRILEVVTDSRLFSSAQKFMAMRRVSKVLANKPRDALAILATYEQDIILSRNTLAHAKEEVAADGTVTLRSFKRGQAAVTIDDNWMVEFRGKLKTHRLALSTVCDALGHHVRPHVADRDLTKK